MANRPTIQRGGDYAKAPTSKKPAAKKVEIADMTRSTPVPPPPSDAHPMTSSKPPPKSSPSSTPESTTTAPGGTQKPLSPPNPVPDPKSVQTDVIRHTFSKSSLTLVVDRTILVRRTRLEITRTPGTCKPLTPTKLTVSRAGSAICELSNALDLDIDTSSVVGNEYVIRSGDVIALSFDTQTYVDIQVDLLATF